MVVKKLIYVHRRSRENSVVNVQLSSHIIGSMQGDQIILDIKCPQLSKPKAKGNSNRFVFVA